MTYIAAELDAPSPPVIEQVAFTGEPLTAKSADHTEMIYIEKSLGEVIEQALMHSEVFRDLGGVVLRSPDTVRTNLSDSLQQTDPQFGMDAALSQFDATLSASSTFSNNDRIFNNAFFAGGTTAFQQDLHEHQIELSKRSATGSTMALRMLSEYDNNNAPANTFFNAYQSQIEGELRQPLLQGAGLEFNRIAGPGATPGVYNGVLIARSNFDITHADFEIALRDFISNVENAYWDLYLAYRELDAKKKAMEQALVLWNEAKSQASGELSNKAQEALARQQYFRLKSEVDDALSGRLLNGTQTRNGSSGGTLQGTGGVLATERRLRLMIGLPANDGTLLRPSDEAPMTQIPFHWENSLSEAMSQRPELHRQNATVKKREMELLAARNFLNPRLDAVGRYRYRGFGDDLFGAGPQIAPAPESAFGQLITGDNQEWSLGVELSMPVGYRQANAAVTHAQLALSRARAIQKEQQREVVSNLSASFADAERAYLQIENKLNQYVAAREYYLALKTQKDEQGLSVPADRIIDAMDRLVRAEVEFFRSRSEYAVSLKNIHYEKGTILKYKDLRIADAYRDETGGVAPIPIEPTPVEVTDDGEIDDVSEAVATLPPVEIHDVPDLSLDIPDAAEPASVIEAPRPLPPVDDEESFSIDLTAASDETESTNSIIEPIALPVSNADVAAPVEADQRYNPGQLDDDTPNYEWAIPLATEPTGDDEQIDLFERMPKRPAPAPPVLPELSDEQAATEPKAATTDAPIVPVSFDLGEVSVGGVGLKQTSGLPTSVRRPHPVQKRPVETESVEPEPAVELKGETVFNLMSHARQSATPRPDTTSAPKQVHRPRPVSSQADSSQDDTDFVLDLSGQ